jgi:2-dehydro-3-deoxyphosphogluconate aldolase/(4S)-4-hydroxy-2-oxoglutarate aldolase
LAATLVAAGLPVVEVTLRTEFALEVIARISRQPGILVGAGTVTTAAQADQAVAAGARFLVSPGMSPAVAERAEAANTPYLPGAATATEIMAAHDRGYLATKFFPASACGGVSALKAFGSVFSGGRFVPTGGIDEGNFLDYLALPGVAAVGGSWMVRPTSIAAGDFEDVFNRARAAVDAAAGLESGE